MHCTPPEDAQHRDMTPALKAADKSRTQSRCRARTTGSRVRNRQHLRAKETWSAGTSQSVPHRTQAFPPTHTPRRHLKARPACRS
ncbi:hypothetical protein NDU88_005626 [Pleurodeles waltl]|uniref:Uncharacterized protein n=1 Tax=Pleurodeles waltl TaxID=8319 RepID=A0AAV7PG36_PLEWA|nr:hypothetical protein NDU88_005626 [Pleurodeles waltl]